MVRMLLEDASAVFRGATVGAGDAGGVGGVYPNLNTILSSSASALSRAADACAAAAAAIAFWRLALLRIYLGTVRPLMTRLRRRTVESRRVLAEVSLFIFLYGFGLRPMFSASDALRESRRETDMVLADWLDGGSKTQRGREEDERGRGAEGRGGGEVDVIYPSQGEEGVTGECDQSTVTIVSSP